MNIFMLLTVPAFRKIHLTQIVYTHEKKKKTHFALFSNIPARERFLFQGVGCVYHAISKDQQEL